jgi:hypothetical protein
MMIRHHIAGAALGLAFVLAAPAFAQAPAQAPASATAPTAAHIAVAREVIELTGISQSFDSVYAEFGARTRQIVGVTRPELTKDMNEVIAALKPEADRKRDEMTLTASDIFARQMSEADLREVAAFFKSPVGQRYNAARPLAIDAIFSVLQTWSVQASNAMFQRFSEEMAKRGHKM